ncbi:DNA double-strand break repair Rad50 ATPase {ECO:0000255/HAMAP-Rule:MF_00449} [Methanothermobacter wolfeii]|uniref:SMC family ATPase n=1 Tax=Methanothermobacter wolfeii TaxID=145261 RepID=A0A9E7RQP0_METWO|nr:MULTISPECIES: SMC family ATPase [Methanothermobacter]UXH30850.1 SMC family ATPase [Methanothermobacter wolfeii]SCM57136.1 DNA double-strand break repair Rad50 ATPase {ECO:0000255/HAMAP-Rule:MF_00449} [Methanothermobacter wolfeii]
MDFREGVTLFEGDIGSGKSTILLAIEFALFGLGDQKGASLLRTDANSGSVKLRFRVDDKVYTAYRELKRTSNTIQQQNIYLETSRGRRKLSANEMKEAVLEILRYNEPSNPRAKSHIYRYAVFTPQEEMKTIIEMNPKHRLERLRKAFGIEEYSVAVENARLIQRRIERLSERLRDRSSGLEDDREKLKRLREEKDSLLKEKAGIESRREALESELEGLEGEFEALNDKKKRIEDAMARLAFLETEIKAINRTVDSLRKRNKNLEKEYNRTLEEIENCGKKRDKLSEELKRFKDEIDALQNDMETLTDDYERFKRAGLELRHLEATLNEKTGDCRRLNSEIRELELKIGELNSEIRELESLMERPSVTEEEVNEKIRELNAELRERENERARLEGKLEDYANIRSSSICPTCDRKVDPAEVEEKIASAGERIKEINGEIEELEAEKGDQEELLDDIRRFRVIEDRLRDRMRTLKEEEEKLRKKKDDLKELKVRIKDIENQINENRKTVEELGDTASRMNELKEKLDAAREREKEISGRISGIDGKISEMQGRIRELNPETSREYRKNLEEIELKKREIEEKKREIKGLQEIISSHDEVESAIERLESEIKEKKKSHNSVISRLGEIKGSIREKENRIDDLRSVVETKGGYLKRADELDDYVKWLAEYFIPALDDIERHVLAWINQEFDSHFRKWFGMLVDDPDKSVRIDEDFTPMVEQDGYEQDLRYLSGGERTSVALAYRLALNKVVQGLSTTLKSDILILDEPTDGFSKEQLYKLKDIFDELDSPQIIIVSHEEELENLADHIYLVNKESGVSRIEEVL